jgi:beta-catenin-like protein 1
MMQTNDTSLSDENAPFYASATWQGPKAGYYFGTGLQGTGYYLDGAQDRKEKKARKSVQIDESNNEMRIFTPPISLLEQAERNASGSTVMELTPKGIQSASQALEKLFHKNALQRAQHADDPQQYMESELALHDQLEALSAVAANVQLYQHIVEHSTLIDTLIQLLGHENDDIAATVVSIFLEWLDPRLLHDDPELNETIGILASRVLTGAWETIVSDLGRFQTVDTTTTQDDDMLKGIENSLSLMENLLDLDLVIPGGIVKQDSDSNLSAAAFMVKETKIVSWLVEQIEKEDVMVDFQSRCLELLSLLAQREDVHTILTDWSKLQMYSLTLEKDQEPPAKKQRIPTTLDAIECMLQVIGRFRKTQPENESYTDLLENACLALSSCITFSKTNLAVFVKGQGIELAVRCLKERVHSGVSALKLLEFVGHDEVRKEACDRLVAAGGLKFLFPLFLGTRIPKPAPSYGTTAKAKREWLNAIETQTIRIFYCLSQHLDDSSAEDAKTRFIAKFAQDETKCDRLVELLLYYDEKCRKAEYLFYRSDVEEVVQDEETIQLAALDAKLKGGGDLFHRLGALAAYLAAHSKRCHERILEQLKLQQSGISLVKSAVEEFLSLLEDDYSRREQLNTYLTKI